MLHSRHHQNDRLSLQCRLKTVSACVISPRIKVKVGFTSETWSVVSEKNPGTKSPWTVGSETPLLIPVTFWLVRVRGYGQLVRVRG